MCFSDEHACEPPPYFHKKMGYLIRRQDKTCVQRGVRIKYFMLSLFKSYIKYALISVSHLKILKQSVRIKQLIQ
jgi:hypothetical protein